MDGQGHELMIDEYGNGNAFERINACTLRFLDHNYGRYTVVE